MLTVPMIIEKVYKGSVLPTIQKSRTLTWMDKHMNGLMCRIIGMKLKKTFGGCVTFYGIGGAKLDPEVEAFLLKAKFPYAIGYGITETAPLLGYYKDPVRTKSVFTEDGWFRTSDIAVQDEKGRFYIKGRNSNMILGPSGENIYPEEIENVLNNVEGVSESSQVSSVEVMKEPFEKTATQKIRRFKYKDSAPTVEEDMKNK